MTTFEAEDVEAAIEMAERFKREGRYDWFRGQTQPWPPYSSAFRKRLQSIEAFGEAGAAYHRFEDWAHSTPGLETLAADENALMAVAQHHGLATHFIDFTTEPSVAGFFAVDGVTPSNEKSCIYCLNTKKLLESWEVVKEIYSKSGKHVGDIECIRLSVANLWRLEAQAGVFVFANNNWDSVHLMDRILFPNTGYPSYPTKEEIYPEHKSQLEILLDHYFELEKRLKGQEAMRAFAKEAGLEVFNEEAPDGFFHSEYFVSEGLPVIESWATNLIAPWVRLDNSSLVESRTVEIRLDVDLGKAAPELHKNLAYGIRRAIERDPTLRNRAVRWMLGSGVPDNTLEKAIAWLWAGLRSLPFDTVDIAEGIGACVCLHKAGLNASVPRLARPALVEPVIGPALVVEFASMEGTGGKGLVGREALQSAVRSDIKKYIRDGYQEIEESIENLLLACFNPRRLFEFDRLAKLFARQIAPSQVLTEDVVTFSPARLQTFGIP